VYRAGIEAYVGNIDEHQIALARAGGIIGVKRQRRKNRASKSETVK